MLASFVEVVWLRAQPWHFAQRPSAPGAVRAAARWLEKWGAVFGVDDCLGVAGVRSILRRFARSHLLLDQEVVSFQNVRRHPPV
jgi:hypothetical protein